MTELWRELLEALEALGVPVEASHHEVADGQHEIDLALQEALAAADAIMTSKLAIKAIAARHHLHATFLPKPIIGVSGSGMHLHQRLVATESGANVFADPNDKPYGLSQTGYHFIAGLLDHASAATAIVAPLVNSYKRLIPDFEAPVAITWGHHNQDTLVRVPRLHSRRVMDVRIELRNPDPSCNPYLALAVVLSAGLDGIDRDLDCPPPDDGLRRIVPNRHNGQWRTLPESLDAALEALETDHLLRETLGPTITDQFLDAKWLEWESYRRDVSDWELQRYLDIF